ncbi:MAG: amino acid adenylation domain-containing protein [Thermoflexales bacterium]|nr:amino acid adenylation domain-containing protein [Thermoflexales bacterium]
MSTAKDSVEAIYPLSPLQEGLLFHTLYAPGSGMYVIQAEYALHGQLDIPAFKRAWQRVMERHAVLRTLFVWERRDKPLQVVRKRVELPWTQLDWQALSQPEQQSRLVAWLEDERVRGFDLGQAPLMRLALMQTGPESYHFVWSLHHLLMDGWSKPLVFRDVLTCYDAFCEGQDVQLEPVHPYKDYIAWLQGQSLTEAQAFWQQTLAGFTAPTPLRVNRRRLDRSNIDPPREHIQQHLCLSEETTLALRQLAQRHRLTLNTLVQGAWALLLSRYSGEQDVLFGTTVSGRPAELAGVESMVGLFINTLPARVWVPPQASLVPWLQDLQAQHVQLRQYEYSPLVQVQQWSDVPTVQPLFDTILAFENYPMDAALNYESSHLQIRPASSFEKTSYPLTVTVNPGLQLCLSTSYNEQDFTSVSITHMLGHLQTLLEAMVSEPERCISDLPMLTEAERQQILLDWNATQTDYPQDACIHQLFEKQVERTPEAVALVYQDQHLSYRELNARANQLAHYLQSLGVGPEVLVGVCVERSAEMVIGLLGILKAGGAYVPLDPSYPQERLAFMLQDAQIEVLLTQGALAASMLQIANGHPQLVEERKLQVVDLIDWDAIFQESEKNPVARMSSNNLAYVLYTSGSTGRPKGVAIEHRSVVALLHWARSVYDEEQIAGVLASTSINWDLSVFELFVPLSWGGCVILVENILHLADLHGGQRLTLINTVPSAMKELVSGGGLPASVQTVNLAGEPLSTQLVQQIYQQGTVKRVYDLYGPSEDTTYSTYGLRQADGPATIGRPIANTQVYLLEANLNPVPIGVPGELYLGGDGLARAYLHRPELTAAKFIPRPSTLGKVEGRLYRTGDLARWLPSGEIEFLGRVDSQIKLRGFRIELGEIEAVLARHPAVREAVVLLRGDHLDHKQLIAYLVAAPSDGVPQGKLGMTSILRDFLKLSLPAYMLPSAFIFLDAFPLTPSGKVDRRALPEPGAGRPELEQAYVAPRSSDEETMAQIWTEVLGLEHIGIRDDFFELGGHSLQAMQLMAQLEQLLGENLPLARLFQHPTIEQLASALRTGGGNRPWSALVPIRSTGTKPPFFCLPGAGGNVIYLHSLAHHLGPSQPFYALQAVGLDGETPPHTSVEEMAAHYIQAIQTVQPHGPYLLGGHSYGGSVAFEMAQQLQGRGEPIALVAILDALAPVLEIEPLGEDWDDARWLIATLQPIAHLEGRALEISYEDLRRLEPDEQLNLMVTWLKGVDWLIPEAGTSQVRGLVQVFRAISKAIACYNPRDSLPTRLAILRSSQPPSSQGLSSAMAEIMRDPSLGWSRFAEGEVMLYTVPGDHMTMMTPPHVQVLAERLLACFEQVSLNVPGVPPSKTMLVAQ